MAPWVGLGLGSHTIFIVGAHAFLGDRIAGLESPEPLVVSTALDVVAEGGCRKESNEKTEEGDEREGLHVCVVGLCVGCFAFAGGREIAVGVRDEDCPRISEGRSYKVLLLLLLGWAGPPPLSLPPPT